MAKTALEQWDETAANNLDRGGVNIAEGCNPSDVNNAMRELMSQVAKWLGGDTVASATTTDLGSVPGRYVTVSGTTTITGLGTIKAGTIKFVKFAGILTLTHNATSLILPGAGNILTAAGDAAIFVSEGSGNWRCLNYTPASGANTSMELLGTLTTTSGGSHAVTSIPAVYRRLYIEFDQVSFASDAYLLLALSSTNGAAYGTAVQASPTCIAGENLGGYIDVGNIQSNTSNGKSIVIALATSVGGVASQLVQRPSTNTAAACNAIRFQNNAGAAFDAGTIRVWGVR